MAIFRFSEAVVIRCCANSVVSAIVSKFRSTAPELFCIFTRVSLNFSDPWLRSVRAACPAVVELHKFENAVEFPSTLSERIEITSPRLAPSAMSSAKDFPVCSSRIVATVPPSEASSLNMAPRFVVAMAVFVPLAVIIA